MKIALISGSHRPTGNSPRITRFIANQLEAKGHSTYVLDLSTQELPFWDEGLWGMEGLAAKWQTLWAPIQTELADADAFIIVSPEYHGMMPSKLANFFLLLGNGATVAHKPALAVTVSAGISGAYPVTELRAFTSKNNRMVYLPEHLIIRNAGEVFQPETKPEQAESNTYLTGRLEWLLGMLESYATAFQSIRASGYTTNSKYANGM